jgi:hypothetical protein
MALVYTPSSGWLVALFHQVRVTLAVELTEVEGLLAGVLELPVLLVAAGALELLELLPLLLHAAAAPAVITAIAAAASARLLRIVVS